MKYDALGYIPNDDECAQELGYYNYQDYLKEEKLRIKNDN